MRRQLDLPLLSIVLLAFFLRFWDALSPALFRGDEVVHIPAAIAFMGDGRFIFDWVHPPLNHLLTYAGMALFGNNPYGWRLINILLGSLTVGIVIVLGKKLFTDARIAYLAGVFLAVEPMHILLSRTNFMEIAPVFFFLTGVYGSLRYIENRDRSLFWVGCLFGLAMAGKWYYLAPIIALGVYTIVTGRQNATGTLREGIYVASSFAIVPTAIYLASFAPWFKMGHTLGELFQLQLDMYHQLQAFDLGNYPGPFVRGMPSTTPWNWFVVPLIKGLPMVVEGARARFMVFMNNPPVWFLTMPACLWGLYAALRKRDSGLALMLLLFIATYGQFALVDRPIFLYSATAVLPFAYLLVSYALVTWIDRGNHAVWPYRLLVSLSILWGIYLYPFISGRLVPVDLYAFLLKIGQLAGS